ncbi:MAG: hypothetical protein K9J12_18630 [Melioribacteraceae bacterium]|nr:hypothetical protein [Melioribacteraceae bacterium]MCF8264705.1 hypothetical protein [Melioribacteraceae bacterium]
MKLIFLLIISVIFSTDSNSGNKSFLKNFDFDTKPESVKFFKTGLNEISGLALFGKYLVTHNDETGVIHFINQNNSKVEKKLSLGKITLSEDFEGIAVNGNEGYLINSGGDIFSFDLSFTKQRVTEYESYRSKFSGKFDIEGLCFDATQNSLLIAAKDYPGKKYKNKRAIYRFDLFKKQIDTEPHILIDLEKLKKKFSVKDFYPSGITISPIGTIIIVSSKGDPAIIEVSREGKILFAKELNQKNHPQPEGIEIFNESVLVIADEGSGGRLTYYVSTKK